MSGLVYGQLGEFNPDSEKISTYLERLTLFMEANGVDTDKKVAVLLTVIGAKDYALLQGLVAPANPREKSVDELMQALRSHYEPKPVIIAERFRFYKRSQSSGETIAAFVAELRRLAINCNFGNFLDDALRDRLVCRVGSEQTQRRLLSEKDLTLAKAVEIAQAMEAADRQSKEMKGTFSSVLRVDAPCYRCGEAHDARVCKFREAKCHKCHKMGHIAKVCKSKKPAAKRIPPSGRQSKRKEDPRVQLLESEIPPIPDRGQEDLPLFAIGESASRTIRVEIVVNQIPLVMEVDTGAAISLLSEATFKSKFPEAKLQPATVKLKTYTGEPLEVLGELPVEVQYQKQSPKQLSIVVVKGNGPSLLGRNWLEDIRLDWQHIASVVAAQKPFAKLDTLLEKYTEVFSEALGTIKPFQAKLFLKEGAKPKFCRSRPVPYAMKVAVEQELDRLENVGVLEKVDFSDWATPVVVVPKKDGRVRLCWDYKVIVNTAIDIDQHPLPPSEELFATLDGGKTFIVLDLSNAYQQLPLEEKSHKLVTINTH